MVCELRNMGVKVLTREGWASTSIRRAQDVVINRDDGARTGHVTLLSVFVRLPGTRHLTTTVRRKRLVAIFRIRVLEYCLECAMP